MPGLSLLAFYAAFLPLPALLSGHMRDGVVEILFDFLPCILTSWRG